MDWKFVNQFLETNRRSLCGCLQKTMKILLEEMNQSQITFKSIQNMLKAIPPDLKIICEDKKEFSSHKLLFGLLNTTLASIFLDDEFINDTVTLFLPVDSVLLENEIFADFSSVLKDRIDKVISKVDVPFATNFVVPTSTSIAKIEKEESNGVFQEEDIKDSDLVDLEVNNDNGHFEEGEIQPSPVKIKIKKEKSNTKTGEVKISRPGRPRKYVYEDESKNRCMNCKRVLKKGTNMDVHLIGCHQNHERSDKTKNKSAMNYRVVCPLCGKSVKRQIFESIHYYKCSNWTVPGSELKKVQYENTTNYENPVACYECGKIIKENSLKSHLKHVHNSDKIFFYCDKCDFKTPNKSTLKGHIKSVHFAAYITCHICGKKVKGHKDQDRLRKHIKRFHEEQEMVKCDECGKELKKYGLRAHKIKVHEERKYACDLCSYKAQTSYNLKLHISKSHHGVKELPKSQCQYCEVVTTNLPYHMKRYHPDH